MSQLSPLFLVLKASLGGNSQLKQDFFVVIDILLIIFLIDDWLPLDTVRQVTTRITRVTQ